jgi:hypothetical protein
MQDESMISWNVDEVVSWLEAEGFSSDWTEAFTQNEIDGEALQLLKDPEVLDRMGVPKPMGIRLKFWQRLENLANGRPSGSGSATLSRPSTSTLSRPGTSTLTKTGVDEEEANDFISPGAVLGASTQAPMGTVGDILVAEEKRFIDAVAELLAELDADDRDVTLLLDLKVRRPAACSPRLCSGHLPRTPTSRIPAAPGG